MNTEKLLRFVDHTLLSQTATPQQILRVCDEGIKYNTASVCIPACYVSLAKKRCGKKIAVCTVIGFPNGYNSSDVKRFEAQDALQKGADELDMVINIGLAKSGDFKGVQREISQIKDVCRDKILKVIVETCLLTEREKIELCRAVSQSGADFIKTSTGFAGGGATDEDIILFKKYVDPHVKIKAAGGISTLEDAHRFLQLGASRLGTSKIIRLICERSENHELSDTSY